MTQGQTPAQGELISFGPFRLFPAARALNRDGVPLALGNRALDILMVLVERAGQVVSHRELISRVWRGLVVDPGNLRVHIVALRRALGDDGGRYIKNITGQGYSFVAPCKREDASVPLVADRLVTLIAPGAIGKTMCLAELAAITDPKLPVLVLRARPLRMLLVLDNEQSIDAAATLAAVPSQLGPAGNSITGPWGTASGGT